MLTMLPFNAAKNKTEMGWFSKKISGKTKLNLVAYG